MKEECDSGSLNQEDILYTKAANAVLFRGYGGWLQVRGWVYPAALQSRGVAFLSGSRDSADLRKFFYLFVQTPDLVTLTHHSSSNSLTMIGGFARTDVARPTN